MDLILTTVLGFFLGILVCLSFGPVQQRIIQCVIHARGLGSRPVAFGGSVADFLFVGVGLVLIDPLYKMESGLIYSLNLFIAAGLFGLGLRIGVFRSFSHKPFGQSPGAHENVGTGFGLGLFNYYHALFWVLIMAVIRSSGGLEMPIASQLGWILGCWSGVLLGYLFTAKWVAGKTIGQILTINNILSRLFGALLIFTGIYQSLKLFY